MTAHPASRMVVCYDGSDDARHAIESAAGLFGGRHALIVTVWEQTAALGSFKWSMGRCGDRDGLPRAHGLALCPLQRRRPPRSHAHPDRPSPRRGGRRVSLRVGPPSGF